MELVGLLAVAAYLVATTPETKPLSVRVVLWVIVAVLVGLRLFQVWG